MAYVGNAETTTSAPIRRATPPEPSAATAPPARQAAYDSTRITAAAREARRRYPGPVGELLYREIDFYRNCGFLGARDGLISRLIEDLLSQAPLHDGFRSEADGDGGRSDGPPAAAR